jgi:hypothetical protein
MSVSITALDIKRKYLEKKKKEENDINVSKRKIHLIKTKYQQKIRKLIDSMK